MSFQMMLVMVFWVLAMISGLSWARRYTASLTVVSLLSFIWASRSGWGEWATWLELGALGLTPWLLAAQRERQEAWLKHQHAEEAVQTARLSETARSLLALQASTQQMESRIGEIIDLYHVTKETARAMHAKELFSAALAIAPRLLSTRSLRFIDLSGGHPQIWRAVSTPDGRLTLPSADAALSSSEEISALGAAEANAPGDLSEEEKSLVLAVVKIKRSGSETAQVLARPPVEGSARIAWAALWQEQEPIGVLAADDLPETQLKTLTIVANQLSLQFSRIRLYQQVEALAVTDELTGLFVRRHFMERAKEELIRSKRHDLSCALLMADLDLFKQKNDAYGHLVGDVILKDVARLLSRNLREVDMIARYGGEEFILLLIETGREQAMPIAERLRQLVEVHPIRAYDELLAQTISIGVAGFPDQAQSLDELIERADRALYAAKGSGRNRVVAWSEKLACA